MNEPAHRRVGLVADRVVQFVIGPDQFGRVGHELSGDGIVRIRPVYERRKSRRKRDAVFGADGIERRDFRFGGKPGPEQVCAGAQRGGFHGAQTGLGMVDDKGDVPCVDGALSPP